MGYLINLSGKDISIEDARKVFEDAVRALRAAGSPLVEGGLGITAPDGVLTNEDPVRRSITFSATEVVE